MNKWFRAAYCVPCGVIKLGWTKLFHKKNVQIDDHDHDFRFVGGGYR